MAVIGELLINISARMDGLDKGVRGAQDKVQSLTSQFRRTVRTVRQLTVGFGALALASKALRAMEQNGSEGAKNLNTSLGRLQDSLLRFADKAWGPLLDNLAKATDMMTEFSDAATGAQSKMATDINHRHKFLGGVTEADIAKAEAMLGDLRKHRSLLGTNGEAENGILKGLNIPPELRQSLQEVIADIEMFNQKIENNKQVEKTIDNLKEKYIELGREITGVSEMDAALDDAEFLGATEDQLKAIRDIYQDLASFEAQRAARVADEEHRAEVLEREVSEFQKLQDFADGVTDSLKGPNEQLEDFIKKVEQAKEAKLLTEEQGAAAIEAERRKLFGTPEANGPVGAVLRGSQDALSAIARFRSGNKDKLPELQLREQRETNRILRSQENKSQVVESLN